MTPQYNPNTGRFSEDLAGKFFMAYDCRGKLLRRGRVIRKCIKTYMVAFVDVWTGTFTGEVCRKYQPEMRHWHFFDTVEELNREDAQYFERAS
jgi:hypothetical protein